jgi:hypothetical protein
MPEITQWHSHMENPKVKASWWKNEPTNEIFLVLDVEVPEGFEVSKGKGLTFFNFKPNVEGNFVRVNLYAKPVITVESKEKTEAEKQ